MDTLEELKAWLAAEEKVKWGTDGKCVTVEPWSPDGFSVWIGDNGRE
jgi:hypothetical protein